MITIPLTISLTLVTLYIIGYNFNIMTLGAIAASIGLIIDDAIVVVEQIHRTHEEHPETPTRALLSKSVGYLLPAMIGSSISTIVIFYLLFCLAGGWSLLQDIGQHHDDHANMLLFHYLDWTSCYLSVPFGKPRQGESAR